MQPVKFLSEGHRECALSRCIPKVVRLYPSGSLSVKYPRMTSLFSLLSRLRHLPIITIPTVIPPSTDGRVCMASMAGPADFRSQGSDRALAYVSSSLDIWGWPFSFKSSLP